MLLHCLKCIVWPKCAVCSGKKLRFIKEQEAGRLLSSLGIKAPLSKILLLGNIFFNFVAQNEWNNQQAFISRK